MSEYQSPDLIPLNDGLPSICRVYGHFWQPTDTTGYYRCSNCQKNGCCSACVLFFPSTALVMRCGKHQHQEKENTHA